MIIHDLLHHATCTHNVAAIVSHLTNSHGDREERNSYTGHHPDALHLCMNGHSHAADMLIKHFVRWARRLALMRAGNDATDMLRDIPAGLRDDARSLFVLQVRDTKNAASGKRE